MNFDLLRRHAFAELESTIMGREPDLEKALKWLDVLHKFQLLDYTEAEFKKRHGQD